MSAAATASVGSRHPGFTRTPNGRIPQPGRRLERHSAEQRVWRIDPRTADTVAVMRSRGRRAVSRNGAGYPWVTNGADALERGVPQTGGVQRQTRTRLASSRRSSRAFVRCQPSHARLVRPPPLRLVTSIAAETHAPGPGERPPRARTRARCARPSRGRTAWVIARAVSAMIEEDTATHLAQRSDVPCGPPERRVAARAEMKNESGTGPRLPHSGASLRQASRTSPLTQIVISDHTPTR